MKYLKLLRLVPLALIVFSVQLSYSQIEDPGADFENYCRQNLAITRFALLGVNDLSYAKCVQSENFVEPEKRLKKINLNGIDFIDDGQNNDLVANDGIMTSIEVFQYKNQEKKLTAGNYHPSNTNIYVADDDFQFAEKLTQKNGEIFRIRCRIVWVPCSSWPPPIRHTCYSFGWPYGSWELRDCWFEFGISF